MKFILDDFVTVNQAITNNRLQQFPTCLYNLNVFLKIGHRSFYTSKCSNYMCLVVPILNELSEKLICVFCDIVLTVY